MLTRKTTDRVSTVLGRAAALLTLTLLAGAAFAEGSVPAPKHDGEPYVVGGDVQKPVKIYSPAPTYSAEAKENKIEGVVIIQVVIDRQGNVRSPEVLKGLPFGLAEQAVDAVSQWKFEPATLDGKPVEVTYNLTVNFRLDKAVAPEPKAQRDSEPFYVMGDVVAPRRLTSVAPDYTAEAKKGRIQGVVIMQVIIDRDGRVKNPNVLKRLPMGLDQKAVDAVKQWTFEPATLNGEPIEVYYNLTINFRLE